MTPNEIKVLYIGQIGPLNTMGLYIDENAKLYIVLRSVHINLAVEVTPEFVRNYFKKKAYLNDCFTETSIKYIAKVRDNFVCLCPIENEEKPKQS